MPRRATYKPPPIDAATIGKRLAAIRKRLGITQARLADQLGMRQALISDYELGKLRLHGGLVVAFAKAFHVSADEILGIKETKDRVPLDRRFVRRLSEIRRLSKGNQQALLKTIDAFLKTIAA